MATEKLLVIPCECGHYEHDHRPSDGFVGVPRNDPPGTIWQSPDGWKGKPFQIKQAVQCICDCRNFIHMDNLEFLVWRKTNVYRI